jgi:hypothetical protein
LANAQVPEVAGIDKKPDVYNKDICSSLHGPDCFQTPLLLYSLLPGKLDDFVLQPAKISIETSSSH